MDQSVASNYTSASAFTATWGARSTARGHPQQDDTAVRGLIDGIADLDIQSVHDMLGEHYELDDDDDRHAQVGGGGRDEDDRWHDQQQQVRQQHQFEPPSAQVAPAAAPAALSSSSKAGSVDGDFRGRWDERVAAADAAGSHGHLGYGAGAPHDHMDPADDEIEHVIVEHDLSSGLDFSHDALHDVVDHADSFHDDLPPADTAHLPAPATAVTAVADHAKHVLSTIHEVSHESHVSHLRYLLPDTPARHRTVSQHSATSDPWAPAVATGGSRAPGVSRDPVDHDVRLLYEALDETLSAHSRGSPTPSARMPVDPLARARTASPLLRVPGAAAAGGVAPPPRPRSASVASPRLAAAAAASTAHPSPAMSALSAATVRGPLDAYSRASPSPRLGARTASPATAAAKPPPEWSLAARPISAGSQRQQVQPPPPPREQSPPVVHPRDLGNPFATAYRPQRRNWDDDDDGTTSGAPAPTLPPPTADSTLPTTSAPPSRGLYTTHHLAPMSSTGRDPSPVSPAPPSHHDQFLDAMQTPPRRPLGSAALQTPRGAVLSATKASIHAKLLQQTPMALDQALGSLEDLADEDVSPIGRTAGLLGAVSDLEASLSESMQFDDHERAPARPRSRHDLGFHGDRRYQHDEESDDDEDERNMFNRRTRRRPRSRRATAPETASPRVRAASRLSATAAMPPRTPSPPSVHPSLLQAIVASGGVAGRLHECATLCITGRGVESVEGLASLTPHLHDLSLADNALNYLTGVPATVMHLDVRNNRLTTLTSFHHLMNLHTLNLAGNSVDDLIGLAGLKHLCVLVADNNGITSWAAVPALDSLQDLSLRANKLTEVGGALAVRLPRLRKLDVAHNEIATVRAIHECMPALVELDLEANALMGDWPADVTHATLESLVLTDNLLTTFTSRGLPALRRIVLRGNEMDRLELDNLDSVVHIDLAHQANLASDRRRHTAPDASVVDYSQLAAAVRLDLAGNYLQALDAHARLYQLVHLTLARCGLRALPAQWARYVPSLRVLDLAQNCLRDVTPLCKLRYLRVLALRGNDVDDVAHLAQYLGHFRSLQVLDLRQNPVTALFYPTLHNDDEDGESADALARDVGARETPWIAADDRYQRSMNDSTHVRRSCYRTTVVYHLRRSLKVLDRVPVPDADRAGIETTYRRMEKTIATVLARAPSRTSIVPSNSAPTLATTTTTTTTGPSTPMPPAPPTVATVTPSVVGRGGAVAGESPASMPWFDDVTSETAIYNEVRLLLTSPGTAQGTSPAYSWRSRATATAVGVRRAEMVAAPSPLAQRSAAAAAAGAVPVTTAPAPSSAPAPALATATSGAREDTARGEMYAKRSEISAKYAETSAKRPEASPEPPQRALNASTRDDRVPGPLFAASSSSSAAAAAPPPEPPRGIDTATRTNRAPGQRFSASSSTAPLPPPPPPADRVRDPPAEPQQRGSSRARLLSYTTAARDAQMSDDDDDPVAARLVAPAPPESRRATFDRIGGASLNWGVGDVTGLAGGGAGFGASVQYSVGDASDVVVLDERHHEHLHLQPARAASPWSTRRRRKRPPRPRPARRRCEPRTRCLAPRTSPTQPPARATSARAPPFAAVHPLRSALSRTWSTVSAAARKRRVSAATSGERSGSALSDASTTDANTRTSDAAADQTASPEAVPVASTTRSLGDMGATATASQQQGQALHTQASMSGHHGGQGGLTTHGSLGHASSLNHHASQGQQHQGPQQQQPVTMDLLTYPTRDLVRIMAALLHDIASANDAVPVASNLGVSRFHARAIPPITIHSYLARILKYAPAPNAVFVAVLVYLDRMARARLPFIVCSANVHRLLITAVMVATKFFSDVFYTNPHYAKVGGLPTNELNQLELEFLFMNEFNLAISPDEFQHYADRLLAHSLGALPPPASPSASASATADGSPKDHRCDAPGPGDATCSNDAAPSTTTAAAASTAPPPEVHVRPPSPASTPSAPGATANANHNVPVAVLDALNLHSAPTSPARPSAGTSASSAAPTPTAPNMLATTMASPISPAPPAHHNAGTPTAPTPARALTMPPVYPPWTAPGAPPPPPLPAIPVPAAPLARNATTQSDPGSLRHRHRMSRPPTPAKPLPPQPLPQLAPFMGHGAGPFPVMYPPYPPSSSGPHGQGHVYPPPSSAYPPQQQGGYPPTLAATMHHGPPANGVLGVRPAPAVPERNPSTLVIAPRTPSPSTAAAAAGLWRAVVDPLHAGAALAHHEMVVASPIDSPDSLAVPTTAAAVATMPRVGNGRQTPGLSVRCQAPLPPVPPTTTMSPGGSSLAFVASPGDSPLPASSPGARTSLYPPPPLGTPRTSSPVAACDTSSMYPPRVASHVASVQHPAGTTHPPPPLPPRPATILVTPPAQASPTPAPPPPSAYHFQFLRTPFRTNSTGSVASSSGAGSGSGGSGSGGNGRLLGSVLQAVTGRARTSSASTTEGAERAAVRKSSPLADAVM
ncbi:hypothetical protein GGF31_008279 [Allomyces arbusculus]|nr:hypothetical protein GGF31_008279 [Allomyces arbusculus]